MQGAILEPLFEEEDVVVVAVAEDERLKAENAGPEAPSILALFFAAAILKSDFLPPSKSSGLCAFAVVEIAKAAAAARTTVVR
jgi:hypothetical protein